MERAQAKREEEKRKALEAEKAEKERLQKEAEEARRQKEEAERLERARIRKEEEERKSTREATLSIWLLDTFMNGDQTPNSCSSKGLVGFLITNIAK